VTNAPAPRVVEIEKVVQRVVVAESNASGGMRCPRCGGVCREGHVKRAVLQGCTRCAGLWVDNGTVARLRDRTDSEIEELARSLAAVIAGPMTHEQRIAHLSCPVCQQPLQRIAIRDTGHAVDVCNDHGTWFDRDELRMFVRAFAEARSGDLSEADLHAAGLPGAGVRAGGGGFFSDVLSALGLVRYRA
jgi:Zn-finger nucleic acid-binding protein